MKTIFQQGYLEVSGEQIHAGIRYPESEEIRFCLVSAEPFGEEKRCSSRMLFRMGEFLAAKHQCAVMKFDFSGTGDSTGEHSDATFAQWRLELAAAAEFMMQRFPQAQLVLAGLRAGALTAALAAGKLPVRKLLLLSPVLSGEELREELLRRRKMKNILMGQEADPEDNDFGGMIVGERMMQELPEIKLIGNLEKLPPECEIHLIHTTGAPKFPPVWRKLTEILEKRDNSTMTLLRDKPFWGQLEYYESDLVQQKVQECLYA